MIGREMLGRFRSEYWNSFAGLAIDVGKADGERLGNFSAPASRNRPTSRAGVKNTTGKASTPTSTAARLRRFTDAAQAVEHAGFLPVHRKRQCCSSAREPYIPDPPALADECCRRLSRASNAPGAAFQFAIEAKRFSGGGTAAMERTQIVIQRDRRIDAGVHAPSPCNSAGQAGGQA